MYMVYDIMLKFSTWSTGTYRSYHHPPPPLCSCHSACGLLCHYYNSLFTQVSPSFMWITPFMWLCRAARHGFRLSGKLKRIKEQEQGLDMASELCCHKSARKCQPRARKRRLDRDNICAMDERKMKIQHTSDAKTAVESCTLTAKTKSIM